MANDFLLELETMPRKTEVELQSCCKRTLELLKSKREVSKAARELALSTPLIQMLASPKPLDLVFTVATTDFEGLTKLSSGIGKITKLAIVRDVQLEVVRHSRDKELRKFWKNFLESIK